ncbi:hypothetical protein F5B22DRAFT_630587 [Xylaria bambusicola]|uniref:uncharacterized protein n=1 Tax=Xylaria bambusicola TaxID=326684 RepID=UPI002007AB28|nr:uncharacterized protein F5B22DRAFT_630587 [Xylaria bambusicola]KAI0503096.1 hypothetical protein F5B22DRAFT_630587 [Xylaria bambusicola]
MVVEDNPFVRFKNHIDSNIRRGWDVLVGSVSPTLPTSSPVSSPQHTGTTSTTATTPNSATSSSISPPLSLQPKMPDSSSSASDHASTAAMSDHHHNASTAPTSPTSPTTPTSPTYPASPTTPTPDPEETTPHGVHDWAVRSPYSPFSLQHLRQPTPNDAPRGCEGTFTFRDAFEDLLVTGSGAPLSMSRTPGWKKCLSSRDTRDRTRLRVGGFGVERGERGDRVDSVNWVSGLGGMGLWDAYFDVKKKGRPVYRDDWEEFRERGAPSRVVVDGEDERERRIGFGFGLGSGFSFGERDRERHRAWEHSWRRRSEQQQQRTEEAEFEDELYDAFRVSFGGKEDGMKVGFTAAVDADGKKDLKIITPGSEDGEKDKEETKTIVYPDGSKRVRTIERKETDGKEEVKTIECVYDKHGNLVSRSKGLARTRSWEGDLPGGSGNAGASFSYSWNKTTDGEDGDRDGEDAEGSERKDENGKNGWFWKR